MEKQTKEISEFKREFQIALDYWKASPDSPEIASKMNSLLNEACDAKLELIFGINDSLFDNPESSRGINRKDIQRHAHRTGNFWIFHLKGSRGPDIRRRVMVTDLLDGLEDRGILDKFNLVYRVKDGNEWQDVLILKPHEITGMTVR